MSMTDDDETDHGPEYQVGAHNVDTDAIQFGDDEGDFVEFQLEARTVFKRLATDIYKSDDAGIREPLTNAVTASLDAVDRYGVDPDEAGVHLQLHRSEAGNQLVFRDNGIGIDEATLNEVVSVIGRSTVRDKGDRAGQFGMGFLAVFRLVGTDGGFVMHTHSRKPDEDPISGVWKSGGFARDTAGELPGRMGDDEYGTKYEFVLKDDIDPDDVRGWVETYAEWARVPVIYQEFDDSGTQVFNEDYGRKEFTDTYGVSDHSITLDTPYFTATTSPDATQRTILLDVPIERNFDSTLNCPWKVDIRFKNENSIVVEGPHEGLMPVAEAEYREMTADRQANYVSETSLTTEDIVMPGPTGTRDVLAENKSFWRYIARALGEKYRETIRDIYQSVDSFSDLFALSEGQYNLATHAVDELFQQGKYNQQSNVGKVTGRQYDQQFINRLFALTDALELAPRNKARVSEKSQRERVEMAEVLWKARGEERDGAVYMGVSLNETKCQVAWEDNPHSQVVRVEDTDDYETYSSLYGWTKLRSIKASTIDDFDVSETLKDQIRGGRNINRSAGLPAHERELTVHFSSGHHYRYKQNVADLRTKFEKAAETGGKVTIERKNPKYLLLFPNHKDEKISDNYWVANGNVGVATCTKRVYEYLATDLPNVLYLDEFVEQAKAKSFKTNAGERTMATLGDDERVIFHVLSDDVIGRFSQPSIMDEVVEYLTQKKFRDHVDGTEGAKTLLYAPIRASDLLGLHPILEGEYILSGDSSVSTLGSTKSIDDTKLYLWARLPNWRETTEFNLLRNKLSKIPVTKGGYELVETFALLHDAGVDPFSERVDVQSHLGQFTVERDE